MLDFDEYVVMQAGNDNTSSSNDKRTHNIRLLNLTGIL